MADGQSKRLENADSIGETLRHRRRGVAGENAPRQRATPAPLRRFKQGVAREWRVAPWWCGEMAAASAKEQPGRASPWRTSWRGVSEAAASGVARRRDA